MRKREKGGGWWRGAGREWEGRKYCEVEENLRDGEEEERGRVVRKPEAFEVVNEYAKDEDKDNPIGRKKGKERIAVLVKNFKRTQK